MRGKRALELNGRFSDFGCIAAKYVPQVREYAASALAAGAKGGIVRTLLVHAPSSE